VTRAARRTTRVQSAITTLWKSPDAKLMEVPKQRTGASRGKGSAKDSSSKRSKSKDSGKQSGRDSKAH
jgi:hypothetical protein